MKVYIDLVILLNFFFDFLLLLSVSVVLKRHVKMRRLLLGSLFGGISIISLFIPMQTITLFFLKILMALIMVLVSFGYQNLRHTIQNMMYLYMISTILGGCLYYLNLEFTYQNEGIVFFLKDINLSYLFLLLFAPVVIYAYIKLQKRLNSNYQFYYQVKIVFKNMAEVKVNAFLDTGNKLVDPVTNKGIILIEKDILHGIVQIRSPIYVPYNSLNNHGLLKCISPKYIEIDGNKSKNYLIGISEEKFKLDGINCILNAKCLEEI